ncbi:MAG TPA: SprB repeat-containing protein, partial [Candidatus Saccharimonadales bacterium]
MKKILFLLVASLLLGNAPLLKAQCYGTVKFDASANGNGNSTFNITTSYTNDLILIAYDGWSEPGGSGPVMVDGNGATFLVTSWISNSGVVQVYYYSAPLAGTHTIVCTEGNYNANCYFNLAEAFYDSGSCHPLGDSNISFADNAVGAGPTNSVSIATTTPNTLIFGTTIFNTGIFNPYALADTGSIVTQTLHLWDGLDANVGYTRAPTVGTYTVSTSDQNSCCGGAEILVAISPGKCNKIDSSLHVSVSNTNSACSGCNGSITINVKGGATPYTYTWSPNMSSTNTATGLCGGTYSCTVYDASCPTRDTTIVVTLRSDNLVLTPSVRANESCNGNCIGIAMVSVSGGYSPYTYGWTPVGGNTNITTGLCAGIYTITIADTSGCSVTAAVTITQPAPLAIATAVNNVLCFGGTGSITAIPTGGTSPYTYSWTGGHKYDTADNLSVGTYSVTVTD